MTQNIYQTWGNPYSLRSICCNLLSIFWGYSFHLWGCCFFPIFVIEPHFTDLVVVIMQIITCCLNFRSSTWQGKKWKWFFVNLSVTTKFNSHLKVVWKKIMNHILHIISFYLQNHVLLTKNKSCSPLLWGDKEYASPLQGYFPFLCIQLFFAILQCPYFTFDLLF